VARRRFFGANQHNTLMLAARIDSDQRQIIPFNEA
jgi:hypothetical protein